MFGLLVMLGLIAAVVAVFVSIYRKRAQRSIQRLVLAGALEEPTEQAFLLFRGTRTAAERFAQADPYVRHGLVQQWRVKHWHTTVGAAASLPMRPATKM